MRIAEILSKYNCPGTFYVPCRSQTNGVVLSPGEVRTIAQEHEIGSHTLDHCYLDSVTTETARTQIVCGRHELENWTGRPIEGFAYPGGRQNYRIRRLVQDAAFSYARTVECFSLELHHDPFRMPTTIQLHPHWRGAYIRNFVKWGHWKARMSGLLAVLNRRELPLRLSAILDLASRRGGVLHLWGHSWEVQAMDLWPILDDFLKQVTERIPREARVTNLAVQQIKASRGVA